MLLDTSSAVGTSGSTEDTSGLGADDASGDSTEDRPLENAAMSSLLLLPYGFSNPPCAACEEPTRAAAAAIVGSEIQSSPSLNDEAVLALFADDSIGCALATEEGVLPIAVTRDDLTTQGLIDAIGEPSIRTLRDAVTDSAHKHTTRGALDDRAHQLGELAAQLSSQHAPSTIVVAGSAFIDDPLAPAPFARSVRGAGIDVELRMIPTHREVVRDIARAVALDFVLREPLAVASP